MITVVIPTIPPRAALLARAVASVEAQTFLPDKIIVVTDTDRQGAARTRQRGLEQVKTKWTAFLDDDDEFLPRHLEVLQSAAHRHSADMVFSWYHVIGGTDPRAEEFGLPWDPENPRQTTITTLVRTDLAVEVGGFVNDSEDASLDSPDRHYAGEDWRLTKRVNDAGGVIYHHPERTWRWYHHASNTSGLPKNW